MKPRPSPQALARSTGRTGKRPAALAEQLARVTEALRAAGEGDFSVRLSREGLPDELQELAGAFDTLVDRLRTVTSEVTRVAREVGAEGRLGGEAQVLGVAGTWKELTDSVNQLAGNLTTQVRSIARVTTAVAHGDLSQKITVDARGEILELKDTINRMVEQLTSFAAEVTRVAREVGTEGQLGGQAEVPGVRGTWKDLTDNVNQMAKNLTGQVRGIVRVVNAVANGELTQKLSVEAKGEIAALADTLNHMTDTLGTFAEQVTTVAHEVGVEGRLGGQANVPGAAGTWRDLTDNVNQLAGNLTTQVRAISEVATAVATGDLSRTIDVRAQGEVHALKEHLNKMIANLRDTTRSNQEQNWLKTNLARLTGLMQGQRNLQTLCELMISELTPLVSAQVGAFFVARGSGDALVLRLLSSYAHKHRKSAASTEFALGQGLVGQCALEKKAILVEEVPEGYVPITSGLGAAPPRNLIVLPVIFEGEIKGVLELASFRAFSPVHITLLEEIARNLGVVFNMIGASTRTEELLEELKRSNAQLEQRSRELEEKATQLEEKNRQVAEASASLEEKARQLATASRYKTEFLANMSHELRTPLNSLLVLGERLAANDEGNLSAQQIEYAQTIHSAGGELLALINQILDLSKIEAGKMEVERQELSLEELSTYLRRNFEPIAEQKRLRFAIELAPDTPETIVTDPRRLQQILKNLLANSLKFTEVGEVVLKIGRARDVTFHARTLQQAPAVIAFSVVDTGIGIAEEKQQLIFEAFQQGDGSTQRTHDGSGLGLTISKELSRLLGGEIQLESRVGVGSRFTLYLPLTQAELEQRTARVGRSARREAEPRPRPEPPAEPSESPDSDGPLAGHSVLLVNDNARELFTMAAQLEKFGLRVLPAARGDEAVDLLRHHSDIELAVTSGDETVRAIRHEQAFEKLPIVALADNAGEDEQRSRDAGSSEVITRPLEDERLLETLGHWLASGRSK